MFSILVLLKYSLGVLAFLSKLTYVFNVHLLIFPKHPHFSTFFSADVKILFSPLSVILLFETDEHFLPME